MAVTPITDIHVWGSWYWDYPPYGDPYNVEFTLSIHEDIPADDTGTPNGYSMPGKLLWSRDFLPGEFEVSIYADNLYEGWYVPCAEPPYYEDYADSICWQYDFYLEPGEFYQLGTKPDPVVYWLDVQARPIFPAGSSYPEQLSRFGWKTSLDHWNDDAVWAVGDEWNHGPWQELRYPLGHPYEGRSIDLAFMITTSCGLCPLDLNGDNWMGPEDLLLMLVLLNKYAAQYYYIWPTDPDFDPCLDLNGDGFIGPEDLIAFLVLLNKYASDYYYIECP